MERARARLGPDDIRALRGTLSRSELAERLGVSPLTVYRWELPEDAPQARRPRGALADRLLELASGASSPAPASVVPAAGLDPVEQSTLLPLLERLSSGDPSRVENDLLALMASGRLGTLAARALGAQALARIALLARADIGSAFATLSPLLAEIPRLPAAAQLELHVTAALVYTWPDGRFFDPGRANTHLSGAERLMQGLGTPELRAFILIARFSLAILQEDVGRVVDVLASSAELEQALSSPVQRTLLVEARAHAAAQAGRFTVAARAFQQLLDEGALPLSRLRASCTLAAASIQDARAPREAMAQLERARELARRDRLQPGQHSIALEAVAGAALLRLGRFSEAASALQAAIDLCSDISWTPAWPAATLAQIHVCTGHVDALRALGARLADYQGLVSAGATRALGALLQALAELFGGGDRDIERSLAEFERVVGWDNLHGDALLVAAIITAHAGSTERAAIVLRRAERHFERAPSIWASAIVRRSRGVVLAREGHLVAARQLIESAVGTLTLAEDVANATHARLLLAQIADALGEAGARELAAQHRGALVQLGYVFGLDDLAALPRPASAPASRAGSFDQLVAPIQRLATRGMSPALIRRELVAIAAELAGPASVVTLEDLDSAGRTTPLLRIGRDDLATTEHVELSDGAGRRLRLGTTGTGSDLRGTMAALAAIAELALELAALRGVVGNPAATVVAGDSPELPGFISVSPSMRQLKADIARLARSRATVIITGESGSGKEVVARAIHELSSRAAKPYVPFNCAAVPRELFEGQLFGYRRGAFTGAASDHPGVLRSADGGTVLLDEIGELPLDVQPKLLRFLENGEILPLGERKPITLDVRVIAATFRDLEQLVRDRLFREDLFYRLHVVPLRVPPLRDRVDDVIALARHFVRALTPAGHEPPVLGPDALIALSAHGWPGNVRELRNVIERSLAFEPLPPVLGAEHVRITA